MPIPLPNLDDRRWADLVEEGRSLIPLHGPGWTDHNVHDPGMTLVDLLAWVTEADLYGLNRIRDAHLKKFLSLVGLRPATPIASRAVVRFEWSAASPGASPISLPSSTEVEAVVGADRRRFRTTDAVTVLPGSLSAVQVRDARGFHDLTVRWQRGEEIELFGPDPRVGDELYLGFDTTVEWEGELRLRLQLARDTANPWRSGEDERRRLLAEAAAAHQCPPRFGGCGRTPPACDAVDEEPSHHSVRLLWEELLTAGVWRPVNVDDGTRSFTLDGDIVLALPRGGSRTPTVLGERDAALYYLRCRIAGGAFDAPPEGRVFENAVGALQAIPATSSWQVPVGVALPIGLEAGKAIAIDAVFEAHPSQLPPGVQGALLDLSIRPVPGPEQPPIRILRSVPPVGDMYGFLDAEAEWLGQAEGTPHERFELTRPLVLAETMRLFTVEAGEWREWIRRDDLFGSRRGERHYILDPTEGSVTLGDGERGRVAPAGSDVLATYETTYGDGGNLAPAAIDTLARSLHNAASISELERGLAALDVTNPVATRGGAAAESLAAALGRAFVVRDELTRAVTLEDCEALALETPGTRLARAVALADLHPDLPCHAAPGLITVIVVPYLPADRPSPGDGLIRRVQAYLDRRRLIGTRVIVTGPRYRSVSVHASVRALPGTDPRELTARASTAMDSFFHALHGGTEGRGWPLGRDVYRSEVLQVLDETPGVDHVVTLELVAERGEPSCQDLCLAPIELVCPAAHRIEVEP